MDPTNYHHEMARNHLTWETLRERLRRDCPGQYVGLAHGRLVATGPTYEAVAATVQTLHPPTECFLIFPVEMEPRLDVVDAPGGGALEV
jgi:hypothetical protein